MRPYAADAATPGVAGPERARGEWVPVDGSPHDGFEGRGPRCGLRAYRDEARSQVCARCSTYEGTIPVMDRFERAGRRSGVPPRVDTDTPPTSRALGEPTVAPQ